MIIKTPGHKFVYDGITYCVGDRIIGTENSEYNGLLGSITEIRDGEDKETENETPDIYCSFEAPVLPFDIEALEKTFSDLYNEPKTLDDIILDEVIMAPNMIRALQKTQVKSNIYIILEEWSVDCNADHNMYLFTDYWDAKIKLCELLSDEMESGCICDWKGKEDFVFESGPTCYECYQDGRYIENHYEISITEMPLQMSDAFIGIVGRRYVEQCQREDFISQVEQWEDVENLSDDQYQQLISDPNIPDRIHHALGLNDSYWDCYWKSISEVGMDMLNQYSCENVNKVDNEIIKDE